MLIQVVPLIETISMKVSFSRTAAVLTDSLEDPDPRSGFFTENLKKTEMRIRTCI